MKKAITFIILHFATSALAQISIKTEYISNSKFYDAVADTNTGDGSAMIYSVGALVPLSMQAPKEDDPYQRPTVWGVSLNGTFGERTPLSGDEPRGKCYPLTSVKRTLVYADGSGCGELYPRKPSLLYPYR